MYPAGCEYHRADSVADALSLLAEHGRGDREAVLLAGGHGLVPDMKRGERAPDVLVDIGRLDGLDGVEADGDGVRVGALARHADLVDAALLRQRVRVLAEAAEAVGDPQIRNRGTVGGNLADAESGADLPAAVLAADATLDVRGPDGRRSVPATDFFAGPGATALGGDDLLLGLDLPADADGGAYVRKTHPATGYALVGVGAALTVRDGTVAAARVAATGATTHAVRLPAVEDAILEGPAGDDALAAAADHATEGVDADFAGDVHASAEYRRRILPTVVERALATARDRASDAAATGGGAA